MPVLTVALILLAFPVGACAGYWIGRLFRVAVDRLAVVLVTRLMRETMTTTNTITWMHKDHGLQAAHIEVAEQLCHERSGFFIVTVSVFDPLPCGLYGPIMGDPPVADEDTYLEQRSPDRPMSRLVRWPTRVDARMTVIGQGPDVIYTAYGGPCAPREPGDPTLSESERAESKAFWRVHALAAGQP